MPSTPAGLEPNPKAKYTYQITRTPLGKGSFSYAPFLALCLTRRTVHAAVQKPTGKLVAAKKIDLRHNSDVYNREVAVLSSLDHPNLVKFHQADVNPVAKTGTIFMDLLSGPNFHEKFIEFPVKPNDSRALTITSKLAEALEHMHSKGIAHRDLKPENVW
jgi:serine/threonine protein kinase